MARDRVPCTEAFCHGAGEWITWSPLTKPLILCYKCLRVLLDEYERMRMDRWYMPLTIGLN